MLVLKEPSKTGRRGAKGESNDVGVTGFGSGAGPIDVFRYESLSHHLHNHVLALTQAVLTLKAFIKSSHVLVCK
jgi:hypothetical protein